MTISKHIQWLAAALLLFGFAACDPVVESKIDIGTPPQASFSYEYIDSNTVRFINTTTDDHFLVSWDFGALGTSDTTSLDKFFQNSGDYPVSLTVFGKGGSSSVTQTVSIERDAPPPCVGTTQFLTNCSSRTWKLNPDAGALFVGPDDGSGATWWSNPAGDVAARACDFNDEYILHADGTFEYKTLGDFFGETYMGVGTNDCYPDADMPADRAAWLSGTHAFQVLPGATEQLQVNGLGAFMGLRKAANGAEVNFPQTSVTYDIVEMRSEATKDILVIQVSFGAGLWRFTLASDI